MIGNLPKKLVQSSNELKCLINCYVENHANKFPFFSKHFKPIIEHVLESHNYPLDYRIVQDIYLDALDASEYSIGRLNSYLESIEKKFGESFLKSLFEEAQSITDPDHFLIRLESIETEIDCAKFLSHVSGTAQIKKLKKQGDILLKLEGQEWKFEVKNFSEEYISLECCKDVLVGMMFLKNNEPLLRYREIRMEGQNINHDFRGKVIRFLHEHLIRFLNRIKNENRIIEKINDLEISAEAENNSQQNVEINIKEINKEIRSLKLTMTRVDHSHNYYGIVYYLSGWWIGKDPAWEKIIEKLRRHIEKARRQLAKANTCNYGIFVRFNVQPEYEEAIKRDTQNPQGNLRKEVDKHNLPIVLYFRYFNSSECMLNQAASKVEFLRNCCKRFLQDEELSEDLEIAYSRRSETARPLQDVLNEL